MVRPFPPGHILAFLFNGSGLLFNGSGFLFDHVGDREEGLRPHMLWLLFRELPIEPCANPSSNQETNELCNQGIKRSRPSVCADLLGRTVLWRPLFLEPLLCLLPPLFKSDHRLIPAGNRKLGSNLCSFVSCRNPGDQAGSCPFHPFVTPWYATTPTVSSHIIRP
jgi:hypothetical protein